MELSYLGKVVEAYKNPPASREEGIAALRVDPESMDFDDKRHLTDRVERDGLTMESFVYLYSIAKQLTLKYLQESSLNGNKLKSKSATIAEVNTLLIRIIGQSRLLLVTARSESSDKNGEILDKAMEIIENDKSFLNRIIDRAYEDATLEFIQGQTRALIGVQIN